MQHVARGKNARDIGLQIFANQRTIGQRAELDVSAAAKLVLEAAVAAGDTALAQELYKAAVKKIDQAAARNIIHKNAAARKKSQFTKALNNM
jgi:ribosomal protein S20